MTRSNQDGTLDIYLGDGGTGKTSAARDDFGPTEFFYQENGDYTFNVEYPHIIVGAIPNNPKLKSYPYYEDNPDDLKKAKRHVASDPKATFAIWMIEDNPDVFTEVLSREHLNILVDDCSFFKKTTALRPTFEKWGRFIRGRHQTVKFTTHRPIDDLPNVYYTSLANHIYWVGPMKEGKDVEHLYALKSVDMELTEEEFLAKLQTLEKYNYANPNRQLSILEVYHR